ncbi:MAG TPA: hypothetical protein VFT94_00575 [Gaiellaceae bacterium]|nr:hypothetical protein [Gaiellaceae bacterium]
MTTNNSTTESPMALAVRDPEPPRAIVPTSINEAISLASEISKSSLIDAAYRAKQADVLHIVLAGQELGLPPMSSLRLFYIEKGLPKLFADGLVAIVMARKDVCDYFRAITLTATSACFETRRRGDPPVRYEYTVQMAQQAGLMTKATWKADPGMMCVARAKARLVKIVYPDLVAGVRVVEDDYDDEPSAPHVAPPPPSRTEAAAAPPAKSERKSRAKADAPTAPSPSTPPASDVIDVEYTEAEVVSKTPPVAADASPSPSAAAAAPAESGSSVSGEPPAAQEDDFGDAEPAAPPPPADALAAELERFRAQCAGAATRAALDEVKAAWLEFGKRADVKARGLHKEMTVIFAERKAVLP